MTEALAVLEEQVPQRADLMASAVEPGEIVRVVQHVHRVMVEAMTAAVIRDGKIVKDGDYGLIPGCGDKPAIRKSGVEKLLLSFGMVGIARKPEIVHLANGHREVIVETEIRNMGDSKLRAIGFGSCSTMESKYRWRNQERTCPKCGQATIIKGKAEYGGGWLCFRKRGGCGARWDNGAEEIESQKPGREENPDIADVFNTVLKIAKKRSLNDGALQAAAASGMFTQDIDDYHTEEDFGGGGAPENGGSENSSQGNGRDSSPGKGNKREPVVDRIDGVFIEEVTVKSGKTNGRDWSLYTIVAEGERYTTFDRKHAETAKALRIADHPATLSFMRGIKSLELVSIEEVREGVSGDAGHE